MWLSADDFIHSDYIKKTLTTLESDKKIVGCFTNLNHFKIHNNTDYIIDIKEKWNIFSKLGSLLYDQKLNSVIGSHDSRIRIGLVTAIVLIYSIFRTDIAKKCFIIEPHGLLQELSFLTRVYNFGEVHILKEFLFNYYVGGISSSGPIMTLKKNNTRLISYIFPMFRFNLFFLKNFGLIQFLKNFDNLFKISLFHSIHLVYDYIKHIQIRH